MNKTKIEWTDYTWNPVTGCKRGCPYCYAGRIHNRFNPDIPFNKIVSWDERLEQPLKIKKPSRIFVGSMSDIEYWSKAQMENVLDIICQCPQHIFMFLTKNGRIYCRYIFPKNCWLGITSVNGRYCFKIHRTNEKNVIFLSLEPLLMGLTGYWLNSFVKWLIIGGLTPKPVHKREWVERILKEADRLHIPVFMKSNLKWVGKLRQEYPNYEENYGNKPR